MTAPETAMTAPSNGNGDACTHNGPPRGGPSGDAMNAVGYAAVGVSSPAGAIEITRPRRPVLNSTTPAERA